MTRTLLVVIALAVTACTPAEVAEWTADVHGIELTDEQASFVADWIVTDCLPDIDADITVECGIRDSWQRYQLAELGISLERWTQVARCESTFDPTAVNTTSGAHGLYQHIPTYWPDRAAAAGWGDDWADPRINAFVSGHLAASNGGLRDWNASKPCWQGTP